MNSMKINCNTSDPRDHDRDDQVVSAVYFSLAIYIPTLISSNCIVIATFYWMESLRTPDNYIIAWLSLADLLYGVVGIPITILQFGDRNIFQKSYIMCVLDIPTRFTIYSLTLSMLLLLTIDRCVSICYPFWYNKNISNFKINLSAVFLVILDIIIHTVGGTYALLSDSIIKDNIVNCTLLDLPKWFKYLFFLVATLRLVICILCTIMVTMVLCNNASKLQNPHHGFTREKYNSMKKDQKMIVILLFMFAFLLLPTMAVPFLYTPDTNLRTRGLYSGISLHLVSLNACLNCMVYAFSRQVYKDALVFILNHRPCLWKNMRTELRTRTSRRLTVIYPPHKDLCTGKKINIAKSISQSVNTQIIVAVDQETSLTPNIQQQEALSICSTHEKTSSTSGLMRKTSSKSMDKRNG